MSYKWVKFDDWYLGNFCLICRWWIRSRNSEIMSRLLISSTHFFASSSGVDFPLSWSLLISRLFLWNCSSNSSRKLLSAFLKKSPMDSLEFWSILLPLFFSLLSWSSWSSVSLALSTSKSLLPSLKISTWSRMLLSFFGGRFMFLKKKSSLARSATSRASRGGSVDVGTFFFLPVLFLVLLTGIAGP